MCVLKKNGGHLCNFDLGGLSKIPKPNFVSGHSDQVLPDFANLHTHSKIVYM